METLEKEESRIVKLAKNFHQFSDNFWNDHIWRHILCNISYRLKLHEMAIPNGNDSRKWTLFLLDKNPIKTSFASK